jgi:electron transfer flavoprotein beta subunit
MNILVCVKWVRDPDSLPRRELASPGSLPDLGGSFRFNRFDAYALEEALRIKQGVPEARVDALTVGPPEHAGALVRALGLGADHAVRIAAEEEEICEAASVAFRIAEYARQKDYPLILTGVMSEDLMQGQVGSMVAGLLSRPCATAVVRARLFAETGRVRVRRELEEGMEEALELALPAVLTIQTGVDQPRYPRLSGMLKAKKYPIELVESRAGESAPRWQRIVRLSRPRRARAGRILQGTPEEKAEQLLQELRQRGLLG